MFPHPATVKREQATKATADHWVRGGGGGRASRGAIQCPGCL